MFIILSSDEDMQSVVSMMSVNNNCDVAPLDDLEDIPDLENFSEITDNLYDFTQQLEQMTTSLNGCIDAATPLSGKQSSSSSTCDLKCAPISMYLMYLLVYEKWTR